MYAVVATTRFLLLVNLENKEVRPLEAHSPEYYGISWFPGEENLVLSHSGLDHADLVDINTYAQSEKGWISSGKVLSKPFLSAPHQILCASDKRVICTNTGRNCVVAIDLTKPGCYQEFQISDARWDRLSLDNATGDHINSVFERKGKLYIVAHRFSKGSLIATVSYPDMELEDLAPVAGKSGLHNIWVTDEGQKISCHSEAGAIVDLPSGRILWNSGGSGYTRGLAASSDIVVVGESPFAGRDLRRSSIGGLWIIDRHLWKAIDYLWLGPYGAVQEVRLLDVPDEAHHMHTFSGLKNLLQDRSMTEDVTRQRLTAAHAANTWKTLWNGFDLVFGMPQTDEKGYRVATADNLCLVIQNALSENRSLVFDYSLDIQSQSNGQSHISAIIGYRGSGGDTDMTALLLQPDGNVATISLWRHDGTNWSYTPNFAYGGMPLSGRLKLGYQSSGVNLFINDKKILNVSRDQLGSAGGPVGVRWIGGRVRPVLAE